MRSLLVPVALLVVAFVAISLLLVGAASLLGGRGVGVGSGSPPASAPPGATGAPTASPVPTASSVPSPVPLPTDAGGPDGDPILVGAGDIADCASEDDEATAALLDDLPGTIFTAGDNVYESGTAATFEACYLPSWGRHLARTRPAPGNHDWGGGDLTGYRTTFAATLPTGDASWYSYDLGAWHIVVLDSECARAGGCDAASPQGRWLADDLARSSARCTLAIWHRPRFSSGYHGDDPAVDPFWRALHGAGADVVVNGHDLDYERFAPLDPDGAEDRVGGLRSFIVGTGGRSLRPFDRVAPHSELRAAVSHGVLEFTLRTGSYDWRFIPTEGDFSDRGTAFCH